MLSQRRNNCIMCMSVVVCIYCVDERYVFVLSLWWDNVIFRSALLFFPYNVPFFFFLPTLISVFIHQAHLQQALSVCEIKPAEGMCLRVGARVTEWITLSPHLEAGTPPVLIRTGYCRLRICHFDLWPQVLESVNAPSVIDSSARWPNVPLRPNEHISLGSTADWRGPVFLTTHDWN